MPLDIKRAPCKSHTNDMQMTHHFLLYPLPSQQLEGFFREQPKPNSRILLSPNCDQRGSLLGVLLVLLGLRLIPLAAPLGSYKPPPRPHFYVSMLAASFASRTEGSRS